MWNDKCFTTVNTFMCIFIIIVHEPAPPKLTFCQLSVQCTPSLSFFFIISIDPTLLSLAWLVSFLQHGFIFQFDRCAHQNGKFLSHMLFLNIWCSYAGRGEISTAMGMLTKCCFRYSKFHRCFNKCFLSMFHCPHGNECNTEYLSRLR